MHVQIPGLHPGWMFGHKVDLSDFQWRDFRRSLPQLSAAMACYLLLSQGIKWGTRQAQRRAVFHAGCSIAFMGALHGSYLTHVLVLTAAHFLITQSLAGTKYGLAAIWTYTCAVFLVVRMTEGLPFAVISPALSVLDKHRGLLRWHIHYNLLVLRMLSFASDLHWARSRQPIQIGRACSVDDNKVRTSRHLPPHMYSMANFLAYALYPPLYIAGPIMTFNSFASQLADPAVIRVRQLLLYALRWGAALVSLEVLTHMLYFNSIAKYRAWPYLERAGMQLAPLHYAEGSYWVLVFMWLKFTVIWRFFRLAALADGVDAPENMTRCVCNNYDIEGFWRSWHASYNQWLVRYMYIPLGGSRWRALNVWVIFTFVALWHDLEWRLLGWAWIMALAMAPEMGAKMLTTTSWAQGMSSTWLWRQACALAAAVNILILMTANLVGFVVGVDGVVPLLEKLMEQPLFLISTLATLFSAVQLMFALRIREQRTKPMAPSMQA